jgi:hypothetical protein
VLQTKNTLHKIWLKSLKGLKRKNFYVAYVSRRVPNSRYTKSGLNRLGGQRVNLVHTDRHTDTHTDTHSLLFIRFWLPVPSYNDFFILQSSWSITKLPTSTSTSVIHTFSSIYAVIKQKFFTSQNVMMKHCLTFNVCAVLQHCNYLML